MISDLTNHLWQSTLFVVVTWLVTSALHRNRASVRYWLWFGASLKFLIPSALLMIAGSHFTPTYPSTELMSSSRTVSLAISRITQPFSSPNAQDQMPLDWTPLLLALWTCGFGVIATMRLREWRRLQRAVRCSKPLALDIACLDNIPVRSCEHRLEPSVAGFWQPVLLLPAGIEQRLDRPQLEAILAHEACHVGRRDNLSAGIHMLVEATFWFYPLVWWISARLLEERERACDEHVLQALGQPMAYAQAIVQVCKLYVESPLSCVPGVTASNLKKRMEQIVNNRIGVKLNITKKAALAAVAVGALAAPIVVSMMSAPLQAQTIKRAKDPSALIRMKETVLKYALFQMRDAIDKYYEKNQQYPRTLEQLVSMGYLPQIPADPFTNRTDSWKVVPPKPDRNKPEQKFGVYDVMSGSEAAAIDGTKYSSW